MTRESCRFLPLFPLRRGDLAIWASTRESAVEPLSSIATILLMFSDDVNRSSSHRERFPFLLLRDRVTQRHSQRAWTRRTDIIWYKVTSYVSIARRSLISRRYVVTGSNPLAGGRRTEARALFHSFVVGIAVSLRATSKWLNHHEDRVTIYSVASERRVYLCICTAYIHRIPEQSVANGSPWSTNGGMLIFIGALSLAHLLRGPVRAECTLSIVK